MAILTMGERPDPGLNVAVAERLLAERAFDPTGNGIPKPNHGSEQDDCQYEK